MIVRDYLANFYTNGIWWGGQCYVGDTQGIFSGTPKPLATLIRRLDGYIPDILVTFSFKDHMSGRYYYLQWVTDKAELYRLPEGTYEVSVLLIGDPA